MPHTAVWSEQQTIRNEYMNRKGVLIVGFIIILLPLSLLFYAHTVHLLNSKNAITELFNIGSAETVYGQMTTGFWFIYLGEILLITVLIKLAINFFKNK